MYVNMYRGDLRRVLELTSVNQNRSISQVNVWCEICRIMCFGWRRSRRYQHRIDPLALFWIAVLLLGERWHWWWHWSSHWTVPPSYRLLIVADPQLTDPYSYRWTGKYRIWFDYWLPWLMMLHRSEGSYCGILLRFVHATSISLGQTMVQPWWCLVFGRFVCVHKRFHEW